MTPADPARTLATTNRVFLVLGLVFLAVGAAATAVVASSGNWELWSLPGTFSLLGLVFAGLGGGGVLRRRGAARETERLRQSGRQVWATVRAVERNTSLTVNGVSPWRIVCAWDPGTGRERLLQSADLWFDPTPFVQDRGLLVAVDGADPRRYSVDLSFLPTVIRCPRERVVDRRVVRAGQGLLATGLVLAAAGAGACLRWVQGGGALRETPLGWLAFFGAALAIGGTAIVTLRRGTARRAAELHARGIRVDARFQSVERDLSIDIQGWSPYKIVCQWHDRPRNTLYVYESGNLWSDPTPSLRGQPIGVFVDPRDPTRFHMELGFLPSAADERSPHRSRG